MTDVPGPFEIRPDSRRFLRTVRTGAPLVLPAVIGVTMRLVDELGWIAGPAVLALVGPPCVLLLGYAFRHGRTVRLAAVDGGVRLTDWYGRSRTLRRPTSVCYCSIYSGGGRFEHLVISGPLSETPLLLRTPQWRPAELTAMWRRLGLKQGVDDLTSVPGVRSRFPGVPLPYATRYPMTTGLLCVLAAFGHIALVISVCRAAADP